MFMYIMMLWEKSQEITLSVYTRYIFKVNFYRSFDNVINNKCHYEEVFFTIIHYIDKLQFIKFTFNKKL